MSLKRLVLAAIGATIGLVLVAPVVLLGIPFFVTAALTRLLGAAFGYRQRSVPWQELVQYEPLVGWKPRPNLDTYGQADDVFHVTTDADGWRGTLDLADSDIVVFGDSFAFGHGASDDDMYTRFCRGLGVKPIGCDGYSMVHSFLWMRRLRARLNGKLVVWFIYCGNDLYESLQPNLGRYRMPFLRGSAAGDWEIATDHVTPEPWPLHAPRDYRKLVAEICCSTFVSRRVYAAADHLIEQARDLCSAAGARLAVVSIPSFLQMSPPLVAELAALAPDPAGFDPDLPDRRLRDSCDRLGVPFVALKEHLEPRHYLIGDIHWNRAGHRRVGAVLADLHRGEHPSRPADSAHSRMVRT